MNNGISRHLLSAYRAARYRVEDTPQPFCLRIDQYSEPLVQLLERTGHHQAAFISAYNPLSERHPDVANARAHRQLKRVLADRCVEFIEGAGQDPAGNWPEETSVLALGLSKIEACRIARNFQQNAIVWMEHDGIPRLVFI